MCCLILTYFISSCYVTELLDFGNVFVCVYICMYVYVCVCACVCVCVCVHMCVCMYVWALGSADTLLQDPA